VAASPGLASLRGLLYMYQRPLSRSLTRAKVCPIRHRKRYPGHYPISDNGDVRPACRRFELKISSRALARKSVWANGWVMGVNNHHLPTAQKVRPSKERYQMAVCCLEFSSESSPLLAKLWDPTSSTSTSRGRSGAWMTFEGQPQIETNNENSNRSRESILRLSHMAHDGYRIDDPMIQIFIAASASRFLPAEPQLGVRAASSSVGGRKGQSTVIGSASKTTGRGSSFTQT
jgi:hypothetical protein